MLSEATDKHEIDGVRDGLSKDFYAVIIKREGQRGDLESKENINQRYKPSRSVIIQK